MAAVLAGLKSVDFYRKLKRDLQQVMLRYLQRELSASLTRERQPGRDRERGRDTNKEGCETRFVYACVEHTHVWNVYHLRTRLPNAWATEQELTEASFAGAALSVCAAIFMILLVIGEFSTYMSVTTESKVVLDHFETSADDTLQVHIFNPWWGNRSHPPVRLGSGSAKSLPVIQTGRYPSQGGVPVRYPPWEGYRSIQSRGNCSLQLKFS
jgi:hypothetical protein